MNKNAPTWEDILKAINVLKAQKVSEPYILMIDSRWEKFQKRLRYLLRYKRRGENMRKK